MTNNFEYLYNEARMRITHRGGFEMKKQSVFIILGVVILVTVGVVAYSLLFGNQYIITFDSDGGTEVESQLVKVGKTVEEPLDPVKEGYEFVEWQKEGEKYDFSSPVKSRFELVAKWHKKVSASDLTYTVTFDSKGGSEVEEQMVLAGDVAIKPTNPIREGYQFLGWYLGDSVFDFSKTISKDITLEARWKANTNTTSPEEKDEETSQPASELKVGDRVRIVGEYASSATSTSAFHKKAIGWKRIVLEIHEGKEYPYRVGNSKGTTGYFKAESLEKIN